MIISRQAAIEALKGAGYNVTESLIIDTMTGNPVYIMQSTIELAKAKQRLWDLCPSERPVDNRVIAMREVLAKLCDEDEAMGDPKDHRSGKNDRLAHCGAIAMLTTFEAKLAELEGGK
jgi:hypothetical protein